MTLADLGPLPVFRWAPHASGVIGLAVVLLAVAAGTGTTCLAWLLATRLRTGRA